MTGSGIPKQNSIRLAAGSTNATQAGKESACMFTDAPTTEKCCAAKRALPPHVAGQRCSSRQSRAAQRHASRPRLHMPNRRIAAPFPAQLRAGTYSHSKKDNKLSDIL